MFTVYVLHSDTYNKIYIGFTSDLKQRLLSHNEFSKKGFTFKYRPWKLIYAESFEKKSDAMKREKELKSSRGRAFIEKKNFANRIHIRQLTDEGSNPSLATKLYSNN